MTAVLALLGFQLLVFVHELGHFLVARATGMRVIRFSIGFGPALLKVTHRDIVYSIGLLPFGGLVQVAGMHGGASDAPSDPGDFDRKPLWARAAMVFAGPAFNIGFAAVLALVGFLGFKAMRWEGRPLATLVLAEVDGPARAAGLLPGDAIVSVDGEPIKRLRELNALVGAAEGRPLRLGVRRPAPGAPLAMERLPYDEANTPGLLVAIPTVPTDAQALDVTVTPEKTPRGWRLGLRPQLARFGADGIGNALAYAGRATVALNTMFLESLGRIFRGEEKAEVTGIVKLVSVGADMIALGLADWFLDLLILISLNLAILNLLPLPALDGGRLLFLAVELVSRRPVPRRLEAWVHGAGFALFLGLVLLVSGQEIWELVSK
jgi:regulator of sigma E protease